jgi:predicted metalloendopeptidase
MYVHEYFEEAARQSMNEMVKNIRSVFSEIIDELEWMDNETRKPLGADGFNWLKLHVIYRRKGSRLVNVMPMPRN